MKDPMKPVAVVGAIILAGVLCGGALLCAGVLFGGCCSGSLWHSPSEPWTTKAGLLAGCIVPPVAGLYLVVQTAKG